MLEWQKTTQFESKEKDMGTVNDLIRDEKWYLEEQHKLKIEQIEQAYRKETEQIKQAHRKEIEEIKQAYSDKVEELKNQLAELEAQEDMPGTQGK